MAKTKKRNKKRTKSRAQREYRQNRIPREVLSPLFFTKENYINVEDRRRFHPDRWIGAERTIDGRDAVVQTTKTTINNKRRGLRYARLRYVNPINTLVCARRRYRRKTLFRRHIAGKGKGSRFWRPRIMKPTSYIRCR